MKKMQKLKVCNWALLIMIIPVLVSGIELEATSGSNPASVRCHIVIASIFFIVGNMAYIPQSRMERLV